jgi:dihydropteroate synthase
MPVLEILLKEIPVPISLDTYKASVAEKALALGVQIINDVGGGIKDPHMAEVVAAFQSPVIVMHNPDEPNYHDLIPDVIGSLAESIRVYEQAGNLPEKIVIDPGIGFGKNHEENLTILKGLKDFQILGKPILLGVSRKSFIGRILDIPAGERVEGSLAAAAWGIVKDVNILRVHDVLETVRLARVLEAIKEAGEHIE